MKNFGNYPILIAIALLFTGLLYFNRKRSDQESNTPLIVSDYENGLVSGKFSSIHELSRILETSNNAERSKLIPLGVKMARTRLKQLETAAKTNPERVLNALMDLKELSTLPPEIRTESEVPFSAVGSVDLRFETKILPDGSLKCVQYNLAIVGEKTWRIAGNEFQDGHRPMVGVPLNGYLVGDLLVLDSTPVKTLTASELEVSDEFFEKSENHTIDPVTHTTADPSVAALIGGEIFHFEKPSNISHVENILVDAERSAASGKKGRILDHGFEWLPIQATGGSGFSGSIVQATPFQADNIRVLFIRANFSDSTSPTVSFNELSNSLLETNALIQSYSYGKASLIPTVTPSVYTLPTQGAVVAADGDNDKIIAEARAAAEEDGFVLTDYDVIGVYFPSLSDFPMSQIRYGGLATIGGSNHWINGVSRANQVEILLHEFGHNYGLFHANYFNPARNFTPADSGPNGIEYLDPNEVSLEYGDIYDRMGEGNKDDGYFSPFAMTRLEWMPPSKVVEPTTSGTFTIHRFDHPNALNNTTLALRLSMGGDRYNWVALRQRYAATAGNAYVVAEGIYTDRPNLIDTQPDPNPSVNAVLDRADSTLPVNGVFRDNTAGVTITNTGSGGAPPNEFITVQVDFDSRFEFQSTNVVVDEASGNAVLKVNRLFNSSGASSVSYSTSAGTASSGTDFHPISGVLNWEDGDNTQRTILIPIRPDTEIEVSESLTLTLSSPTNGVIPQNSRSANITILDPGRRSPDFNPPSFDFGVDAILALEDGRVLVGGQINNRITGNVARFNSDGSEDTTFVKGTGFGGFGTNTSVLSIARQLNDGKLVIGGDFLDYNGTKSVRISRLDANGALDDAFANAIGDGPNNQVRAVAIEADGKILVGGDFTMFNGSPAPGIIRLNSDGTPDTIAPIDVPFDFFAPSIRKILVQDDNKFMICGSFSLTPNQPLPSQGFRSSVARINQNGTLDTTFDPGHGAHSLDQINQPNTISTITRQSDGKYIIGGLFRAYDDNAADYLARVDASGSFDSTFVPPPIVNQFAPGIGSIRVLQSGTILAVGSFTDPAGFVLALQPSGAVDSTFNLGDAADFTATAVETNDQGDLFIGGGFLNFAGEQRARIVKVAGGLQPYIRWRDSSFSITQVLAGNTDPESDFDNDGILNITEMALGLSPTTPNSPQSFAIEAENLSIQTSGDSRLLQATMERSADNIGVWLVAQFSSDLVSWLPENPVPGSNSIYDVIESSPTRITVRDKGAPASGEKRFVRFRAVVPN